jgi:mono/diheme cytochrome c family protein
MNKFAWFLFGVLIVLLLIPAAVIRTLRSAHGFSALDPPGVMEKWIAENARDVAMPAAEKQRLNPLADAPEVIAEARAHWADHCASCHANNGSGDVEMGKHLYPPAPDMRAAATQNKSDGELFFIIQNGVRMTGMPAWRTSGHDEDSWKLVRFIRHLPQLTPQEELDMQELNPKAPDDLKEEQEEKDFLNGAKPSEPTPHHH